MFKERPKGSKRNLINYEFLPREKKTKLFAFLMTFHIVISEKAVELGSTRKQALILDSLVTSCIFRTDYGPSIPQILVFKMAIDNICPYFIMVLQWKIRHRLQKVEDSGALCTCNTIKQFTVNLICLYENSNNCPAVWFWMNWATELKRQT